MPHRQRSNPRTTKARLPRRAFVCPPISTKHNLTPTNHSITMAIKLIANYSKRLGLPGYSSHQFSVSVETELVTTDDIPGESERIYHLLQSNVDEQIQATGFVPPHDYGMPDQAPGQQSHAPLNGGRWKCSDKQKALILKLVDEHQLKKLDVEELAIERFGHGVCQLGKLEASGLIDELIDTNAPRDNGTKRRPSGRSAYSGNRQGGGQ